MDCLQALADTQWTPPAVGGIMALVITSLMLNSSGKHISIVMGHVEKMGLLLVSFKTSISSSRKTDAAMNLERTTMPLLSVSGYTRATIFVLSCPMIFSRVGEASI